MVEFYCTFHLHNSGKNNKRPNGTFFTAITCRIDMAEYLGDVLYCVTHFTQTIVSNGVEYVSSNIPILYARFWFSLSHLGSKCRSSTPNSFHRKPVQGLLEPLTCISPCANAVRRVYVHNQTAQLRNSPAAPAEQFANNLQTVGGMGNEVKNSPERAVRMRSHFHSLTQQYVNMHNTLGVTTSSYFQSS